MTVFAFQPFVGVDEFFEDDTFSCGFTRQADDAFIEALADTASDILAYASGGRMRGRRTVTLRPVNCGGYNETNELVGVYARTVNGATPLPLPDQTPVVTEVVVDGVVLSPAEYKLVDGHLLLRVGSAWPSGNNLELDDTEVGTWSITVTYGTSPDRLTKQAAFSLIAEMGAPFLGRKPTLPDGTVSATYQGVSLQLEQAAQRLSDGLEDATQAVQRFLGVYGRKGAGGVTGVWAPGLDDYGWTFHTVAGASGP